MKVCKDIAFITGDKHRDKEIIKQLENAGRLLQVIQADEDSAIIDKKANHVVCNGRLTVLSNYLADKDNTLESVVILGGFVGINILKNAVLPEEYKSTELIKDEILSEDVDASLKVLKTSIEQVKNIYMLGKNISCKVEQKNIIDEVLLLTSKQEGTFRYLGVNPHYDKECDMWGSGLYLMFKEGRSRVAQTAIGIK